MTLEVFKVSSQINEKPKIKSKKRRNISAFVLIVMFEF